MLLLLLIIIFTVILIAYFMAFYAPKRVDDQNYHLPKGSQYRKHLPSIRKSIDEMLKLSCEEVYIDAFDDKKLFGRYYHRKDNAPIQIQFHGYKSTAVLDFCGGNHLAGIIGHNTLVVDQRSHGKSEGRTITFGIKERRDCLCWIHYVLERFGDDTPVILCGLSMGAATVLMATDMNLPKNVKGIIADCPYTSPKAIIRKVCKDRHIPPMLIYPFIRLAASLLGHFDLEESDAVSAVSHTDIPILLFHGEADRFVPFKMSRDIAKACSSSVTLITVPAAGHGLCYSIAPQTYEKATLDFVHSILD